MAKEQTLKRLAPFLLQVKIPREMAAELKAEATLRTITLPDMLILMWDTYKKAKKAGLSG